MCPAVGAGKESPSHGFAVPAPFRQGGQGTGGTDCHSRCAHRLRNDRSRKNLRVIPRPVRRLVVGIRNTPAQIQRGYGLPRARCALAMTHYKKCGASPGRAVGELGEALPVADEASRFRGSAPIGGHDSDRESVGTTVGNRRPLRKRILWCVGEGLQGVRCGEESPVPSALQNNFFFVAPIHATNVFFRS